MRRAKRTARRRYARKPLRWPRLAVRERWILGCIARYVALGPALAIAQPPFGGRGGPSPPAQSPRDAATFDATGYWVSIVNEDWRWRMVTPAKGDYESLGMLNREGRAVADAWDPATDGSCKAYGAAGLLRMPTRLRIGWQSDTELETDAGQQRRLFHFSAPDATAPPSEPPSLQGTSEAEWQRPPRPVGGNIGFAMEPPPSGGSLKVSTTNLLPRWLRRNGVPYSDQTREAATSRSRVPASR